MSQKEIRPDKVAIYIRWSTDDQSEGTTLAVQKEACEHYVRSQGWQVREDLIFIDDGHSGGSLDRPAMTRLRKAVKDELIDCVVVFKLDRLSRSVIDTVTLVLQEWEDLTHLKSAREPVDTTSAMGKQFFYMLVSYAEWERNVIRERMFGGKLRRAKEGRSPGMPSAYGYKKGPTAGSMEIVPAEAEVVRMVYEMAERGESVRKITFHLNGHGYPSRKGAPWGTSMVSKMLHNPIYTGQLVWGRRRVNPRYGKAPGEKRVKMADPHVEREAVSIPAIITKEQYDRVQLLMEGNHKITPGALGSEYLLTGLLKCGKCGRFMQFNGYEKWKYYRCGGKAGQGICDAPSIPARKLDQAVLTELRSRYDRAVSEEAREHAAMHGSLQVRRLEADLAAIQASVAKFDAQEKRINHDYLNERIGPEDRRQLLAQVSEERASLLREETNLSAQVQLAKSIEQMRSYRTGLLKASDSWECLDMTERKQILRFFVAEISAWRRGTEEIQVNITWTDEQPQNLETPVAETPSRA